MGKAGKERYREELFSSFPVAQTLDTALRSSSNRTPIFYTARSADIDLRGCWWAIGRLGPEMEKQFSIAGEVVFLFTPYEDLQRRTFNSLTENLRTEIEAQQLDAQGRVRFTPDPTLAFIWSPDLDQASKLDAWNDGGSGTLVAEIPNPRSVPSTQYLDSLRRAILQVLASRDLYKGRNPVTGNDFFGRQDVLKALRGDLGSGRSVGLFGLRRAGKTSVIKEFAERYRNQDLAVVTYDLEGVERLGDIPRQVSEDLNALLLNLKKTSGSAQSDRQEQVWIGSMQEQTALTFADLSTRLIKVAQKNPDYKFVIAIDEVESLVPFLQSDPIEVRLFLGSLRRAAQTADNLALLLTGVTTKFFSNSLLSEDQRVENPMFGFVEELFLRPFRYEETENLVRKLGKAMMIAWDDDALQLVHDSSGGFPFLVRDLASNAATQARTYIDPDDNGFVHVSRLATTATIETWRSSAFRLWSDIIGALESHHPLMAELLRTEADTELEDWISTGGEAEVAASALQNLGMIEFSADGWRRTSALLAMQRLGRSSPPVLGEMRAKRQGLADAARRIETLSAEEESRTLEFKSTLRTNLHTNKNDDDVFMSAIKTIAAFGNSSGGVLLLGVTDRDGVIGVDGEIAAFPQGRDGYERCIRDKIGTLFSGSHCVTGLTVEFVMIDERTVCALSVEPASKEIWCKLGDEDVLFVRDGPKSIKLSGPKLLDHLNTRFPRS